MQSSDKRLLMTGSVTDLYGSWTNFLAGGDGFVLSFLAGMLAIAFHARNRLQITAPLGDVYDFVRLLSLPTLVGQHHFRRSYFIYVFLLEVFFIFLCLAKPLFPNIVGNQPGYEGAGWPLGAALVVVGVLPTLPWIDQIELSLRRFALSAADIPNEFFRRVARLSQSEIKRHLQSDPGRGQELSRYWRLHNLALLAGCSSPEANDAARRGVGLDIFAKWTVDDTLIWNDGERAKLKEVFDLVRSRSIVMREALNGLASDTSASPIVTLVAKNAQMSLLTSPMTDAQINAVTATPVNALIAAAAPNDQLYLNDLANYSAKAGAWRKVIEELSLCNRQLCAVFATLAVNDPDTTNQIINRSPTSGYGGTPDAAQTVNDDIILREMLITLKSVSLRQPYPAYNSVAMAAIIAFILCFSLIFCQQTIWGAEATRQLASIRKATTFEFSFFTSLTLAVTFLAAGLCTLFIRRSNLAANRWQRHGNLLQMPLIQYAAMLPRILISAFIPYTLMTIGYAYYMGDIKNLIDLNRLGTYSFVGFCMSWSLIPAVGSIGLCAMADHIDVQTDDPPSKSYLALLIAVFSGLATFVGFLVIKTFMLAEPGYDAILWSTVATVPLYCAIASTMFATSYMQNLRTKP